MGSALTISTPLCPLAQALPVESTSYLTELWSRPELSSVLAAGYLLLLTLMWLGLLGGVGGWGRRWRLAEPEGIEAEGGEAPFVSICIPARDEAHQIGACVGAALRSDHRPLEVVVVDDRSSDGTGQAALDADDGSGRLRVIAGTEPPAGWAGKPWACTRAAGEARGAILLFVDADVQLHPAAVRALVDELVEQQLSLLSAFGTWKLETFWERVVIPVVGWLIRGSIDMDRVHEPGRLEAFANGQLLMVERGAYEAVEGHKAVAGEVLDDVRMAQVVKRRGGRIGLRLAPWAFQVRLYRNLREIVHGYSKNLYEGMERRPGLGLGAVLFIFVGTLLPWLLLAAGVLGRVVLGWAVPGLGWLLWIAVICVLQVVFRWRLERADGRDGSVAWSHAVGNAVLVWILLRSVFGLRAQWKGRSFVDGKASS